MMNKSRRWRISWCIALHVWCIFGAKGTKEKNPMDGAASIFIFGRVSIVQLFHPICLGVAYKWRTKYAIPARSKNL